MKSEKIIVRVEKDVKKNLQALAQKDRRELSDYIRIILEDAIKKEKKK